MPSAGNDGYGIYVERGARLDVSAVDTIATYGGPAGSGGDVYVEEIGEIFTYSELADMRRGTYPVDTLRNAVEVEWVEDGTTAGTASLRYTVSGTSLEYKAPSDVYGATVDVSGGGYFYLSSDNGKEARVLVYPSLPASGVEDTFEISQDTWVRTKGNVTMYQGA